VCLLVLEDVEVLVGVVEYVPDDGLLIFVGGFKEGAIVDAYCKIDDGFYSMEINFWVGRF
jgi:hypothetical protein